MAPSREGPAALASRHWPLLVVLVPAALLRLAATIAYRPALFFSDSWQYLDMALRRDPVGLAPDRPSGYPLVLKVLSLDGRTLEAIAPIQHLAGLTIGILLYALLVRLAAPRGVAAAAVALVLLESHGIALEEHIMAEGLSTAALVGSVFLLAAVRPSPKILVASGLLLAAAISMRTAVTFALPVWLGYAVWVHRSQRRALLAGVIAVMLPLLVYAGGHAAAGKGFGLTEADGWFLYGSVAPIADCSKMDVPKGTEPLCVRSRQFWPGYYVWDPTSPANRLFGGMREDSLARSNRLLRQFSTAAVRARPFAYGRWVGKGLLAYLDARWGTGIAVGLPKRPRLVLSPFGRSVHRRYFPSYEPRARWPARALAAYAGVARARGWMLAPLALLAVVALALALVRRDLRPALRPAETLLLLGVGVAMLVGATATVGHVFRYLIPTVPFFAGAGALAIGGLVRALR
jgi:hypothetical protein